MAQRQDDHQDAGEHGIRGRGRHRDGHLPGLRPPGLDRDVGRHPDGSTYVDPGILCVSYFHGGDALHYYNRPPYGFPQSDGCVEMPLAAAATIWPYTPVGAPVDVST